MADITTATFDLNDPAVIADPYPHYRWLRDEAPVHHTSAPDLWLLSRYDDVVMALRDNVRFSSDLYAAEDFSDNPFNPGQQLPRWVTWLVNRLPPVRTLLTSDPPQHTRFRKKVSRAFAPRRMSALEPRIREITEGLVAELLARAARGERVDLVRDLAGPLPTVVIAELLGIPAERRDDFKRWSDDLTDGLLTGGNTRRMVTSAIAIRVFFGRTIRRRRRHPGDDLISLLITPDADGRLNLFDLVNFCILLLVGGHETTTNLISNAVLALLDRPDLWQQLTEDPAGAATVVEEALRYDGPAQNLLRITTTDVTLHGVTIPAGARVLPLLGSANRDPRHWDSPDDFRLDRNRNDHIAFGIGIHYCIANALARMEAAIALEILAARVPGLTRAGEPVRIPSPVLRGLRSLPMNTR
ncbi:cytochrome P450 [Nocardia uniformis]|uniref:Cytochrome P450 n=1 Tax=Nocardia uniformis TaxID=53432 RepID=A0A849C9H7_9NOCA|nr:cytochrome P450 [Nocardia uniformis]NNH72557.1 cytochrome P450 [Nocardia uniformis]